MYIWITCKYHTYFEILHKKVNHWIYSTLVVVQPPPVKNTLTHTVLRPIPRKFRMHGTRSSFICHNHLLVMLRVRNMCVCVYIAPTHAVATHKHYTHYMCECVWLLADGNKKNKLTHRSRSRACLHCWIILYRFVFIKNAGHLHGDMHKRSASRFRILKTRLN